MTVPLIYTSRGNVPLSSLAYEVEWDVQDDYIKFTERHRDEAGEVVKESAHVYDRKGMSAQSMQGAF